MSTITTGDITSTAEVLENECHNKGRVSSKKGNKVKQFRVCILMLGVDILNCIYKMRRLFYYIHVIIVIISL